MTIFWICFGVIAGLILLALITAYICFHIVFYSPARKLSDEIYIPPDKVYEPFREDIVMWTKKMRETPATEAEIRTCDGLTLRGRFYEYEKGAPIELMLHGYRSSAERDLSGGVFRAMKLGRSAFVPDHRACGRSDGHIITFGAKESDDCLLWIDYILTHIDPEAKIILTGISMGAATVLITAARALPPNVVGVIADCGYTSAEAIIKKVMRDMRLPVPLLYPFVVLGARVFGRFDIRAASPLEAMKKCRVPVIFVHGDADDFVPHSMSVENFETCTAHKHLVTVEGAGHGLSYLVAPERYREELTAFFENIL